MGALTNRMGVLAASAAWALTAAAEPPPVPMPAQAAPLLHYESKDWKAESSAILRTRTEGVSSFPLDRYSTNLDSNFFFLPQVRLGVHAEGKQPEWPFRLQFDYEHDVVTGTQNGAPRQEIGSHLPNGEKIHDELRRLFGRVTVPEAYLVVGGGYTVSHWGIGLLANDGAHGWTPGSARFSDPRSGDRVVRASVGTVPLTDYAISLRLAWDDVVDDDILLDDDDFLDSSDDAIQYIGSVVVGQGRPDWVGLYVVYREQNADDGRGFDAVAYDLSGSTTFSLDGLGRLTLSAEGAVITGHTTLAPTVDFSKHDLLQFGAAVRAELDRGNHGFVLDFLYASGDENFDDDDNNGFRVDPNYEFGLLLFRQVLAAQTGRATVTASDPSLIGRPVPDLERVPTGGGATNTIAFFPRGWWRPVPACEVYGGPLVAFNEVDNADPFNSRLAGGDPRNALAGKPGRFYGVELDLGTRYRALWNGAEFTLGAEAGVLFPGDALDDADGHAMGEVFGGRLMVEVRL